MTTLNGPSSDICLAFIALRGLSAPLVMSRQTSSDSYVSVQSYAAASAEPSMG